MALGRRARKREILARTREAIPKTRFSVRFEKLVRRLDFSAPISSYRAEQSPSLFVLTYCTCSVSIHRIINPFCPKCQGDTP
jgi:hypothetical protein